MVYLAQFPEGCVHKLLPIYIVPYVITPSNVYTLNYTIDLPEESCARNTHSIFHVSMLKPHIPNDDE